MESSQKQSTKSLQILLWIWFGVISSTITVNFCSIIKLQTEMKNLNYQLDDLEKRHLILKYKILK